MCDDVTVESDECDVDIAGNFDENINLHELSINSPASKANELLTNPVAGIRPLYDQDGLSSALNMSNDNSLALYKNFDVSKTITKSASLAGKGKRIIKGVNIPNELQRLCVAIDEALGDLPEPQPPSTRRLQVEQVEVSLTVVR